MTQPAVRVPNMTRPATGFLLKRAVAAFLVCAAASSTLSPASAHFTRPEYSYNSSAWAGNSPCSDREDPVTVVFKGDVAYPAESSSTLQAVTGWSVAGNPGSKYVSVEGGCRVAATERASDSANHDRYHIRFWDAHCGGYQCWNRFTAGTPHWEEIVWCRQQYPGHAVTQDGFDRAKRRVKDAFRSRGYNVWDVWWGNTLTKQQCSGNYAGSNGTTWYIQLGRIYQ
jgi:hypothetical protein